MSRKIDTSKSLSEDDIRYLRDRNRLPKQYKTSSGQDVDESQTEEEQMNYEDMTVEQLRLALNERGLDTEGRKNELVKRLRENDEEFAEF